MIMMMMIGLIMKRSRVGRFSLSGVLLQCHSDAQSFKIDVESMALAYRLFIQHTAGGRKSITPRLILLPLLYK